MITLRIKRSYLSKSFLNKALASCYSTSIEPLSKDAEEERFNKELKRFERLTNITKRTRVKKPQRPPFLKNLTLGVFDSEILTFPQLEFDEVKNVESEVKTLSKLLKQRHMVDVGTLSNKNFRQNLADCRAMGLQASQFLDARESTPMEVMRFLETLSEHKLSESIVQHEVLGVQTLVNFASDALQKKYLHPIILGEKISAFCIREPKITDINSIQTKANLSKDEKHFILNGTKTFVVNGASADYFIVFALTNLVKKDIVEEPEISALLVEKDFPGVSWKKLEAAGVELAEISFQNVQVPVENVIGNLNQGDTMLKTILTEFRLSSGPACSTLTKNMLANLYQTVVDESTKDVELYKTEAVRSRIGEILMYHYAADSVTYLTAGLKDWYQDQDLDIESAIVKVLSSEVAYKTSSHCLDICGLSATLKDHWARKSHDNVLNYFTLHETNDSLRIFIALMGLEYAGKTIGEKIKKLRNPFFHSTFILKRIWTERRNNEDNPKLDLGLDSYLHPSLVFSSRHLEYCVKRLEFATERILARDGIECINSHMDLRKLADVMIDCYAMTAVLARASRSHCLGLQFSNYEIAIANAFCALAKERVKKNVLDLYVRDYRLPEKSLLDFAKQYTRSKKYFIEHPISRFY